MLNESNKLVFYNWDTKEKKEEGYYPHIEINISNLRLYLFTNSSKFLTCTLLLLSAVVIELK